MVYRKGRKGGGEKVKEGVEEVDRKGKGGKEVEGEEE